MIFKRKQVEEEIKRKKELEKNENAEVKGPLCDVCLEIDKMWAANYAKLMDLWQVKKQQMEASDDLFERLKLPNIPPLENEIQKAIDYVLNDYRIYGNSKYKSICEQKLKWSYYRKK